eukprot:TRINITY_DN26999_c0_g1_i1.p1 TRINITY_DN26999_c0_g1~~TRINITY_DN26999_c0_g1_i1.p1  ORF type:complete len:557 (-),score=151.30 TRINITY_DN26999_c0_g1_i1:168-1838(-)
MAWTGRGTRATGSALKMGTPDTVGPGHYYDIQSMGKAHYAPGAFGTTRERTTADTLTMCGAAPGAYSPQIPKGYDSGLPRKQAPFGSTGKRGEHRMADPTPGPGDFKVEQIFAKKEASRTMGEAKAGQRPMFRSSSAPSIPTRGQCLGYEEVGDGRLMRQQAKNMSLSGTPADSAGPGQYEIPWMTGSRAGAGRFTTAQRDSALKPSEVPGPGHYVVQPEARGNIPKTATVVSSFASQASRLNKVKAEEMPGPGQYNPLRKTMPSLREQHSELQYFGSTVERFAESQPDHCPGPGQYYSISRQIRPCPKPFGVSAGRFQAEAGKAKGTPGPGSYEPQVEGSTSGPMGTVSILGAMGGLAFGSMERRIKPLKAAEQPGPGAYEPPGFADAVTDSEVDGKVRSVKRHMTKLPSAAFKSMSPKDDTINKIVKAVSHMPPPGAYDPVHAGDCGAVVRMPPKGEGFGTGGDRFKYAPQDKGPGPGSYIAGEVTGGKKMSSFNRTVIEGIPKSGRPQGMGFGTQGDRFRAGATEKKGPGPGAYHTSPGWITKTHNVYFGDVN